MKIFDRLFINFKWVLQAKSLLWLYGCFCTFSNKHYLLAAKTLLNPIQTKAVRWMIHESDSIRKLSIFQRGAKTKTIGTFIIFFWVNCFGTLFKTDCFISTALLVFNFYKSLKNCFHKYWYQFLCCYCSAWN